MAESECTLDNVRVLGPNKLGVALSLGVSAAAVLATIIVLATMGAPHGKDGASFLNVMFLATMFGGAGAYWFSRVSKRAVGKGAELRATDNGVYIDGKRLVGKKEIASAMLWPGSSQGAVVRVTR